MVITKRDRVVGQKKKKSLVKSYLKESELTQQSYAYLLIGKTHCIQWDLLPGRSVQKCNLRMRRLFLGTLCMSKVLNLFQTVG